MGSRVFLSARQVRRYAASWDRMRCRERWQKWAATGEATKAAECPPDEFRERYRLPAAPQKALEKDHGEYYSLRQAANALGVSRSRMKDLLKQGRLKGCHLGQNAKQEFNRRRHWFFKKADIGEFKSDFEHQRQRRAYLKRKFPWIYDTEQKESWWDKEPEYRPHEWNPEQFFSEG